MIVASKPSVEAVIPKVVHYCWFGGNSLPRSAMRCIASWRKFLPGYEIVEWNESNYDVRKIPYIAQAYDAGKYAFVSDFARFDILYQHGGVYFDTDVEVIRPIDDILVRGAFMGCEIDGTTDESASRKRGDSNAYVNPGLGIAAAPGLRLYKDILDYYAGVKFVGPDGVLDTETVVLRVTRLLRERGLEDRAGIQEVADITIYPAEYFNPFDSLTGELRITENTRSIHWYTMSWLSPAARRKVAVGRWLRLLKSKLMR